MSISLYIPCHDAGSVIAACIGSVRSQSLPPDEIIVVDDASTDRTADIARAEGARVIRLPSHPGLAAARNAAVRAARHEFIASIDADCVLDGGWIAGLMRAMSETGAAGAGGRLEEKHQAALADRWRAAHMRQNWGAQRLLDPPFLFGCNTLYRKEALDAVGLYDERYRTNGEDVNLSVRLAAAGHRLVYEPSAVAWHLKRDTALSVLRADWRWGYLSSGETAKYERSSRIVYHNFTNAKYRFSQDLACRRWLLLPLDVLLFPLHTHWDLCHARAAGLLRHSSFGVRHRLATLTDFHDHLVGLSERRFLRNPDSPRGEAAGECEHRS